MSPVTIILRSDAARVGRPEVLSHRGIAASPSVKGMGEMPTKRILDERPIYYCYILFDWFGIPRWVGKGKGSRDLDHERKSDSSNRLKNEFIEQTWLIFGEIPKIRVRENIIEKEALETEVALIKAIGRFPNGPLVNMTDGGDGTSGYKFTDMIKAIIGEKNARHYAELSKEERSERARQRELNKSEEQRSEAGRKRHSHKTPEQHSASVSKRNKNMAPAKRRAAAQRGADGQSKEKKSDNARKANASRTPEKRKAISKIANDSRTSEQKRADGLKGLEVWTVEQRSLDMTEWQANRTPEQRRASGIKSLEALTRDERSHNMREWQASRTPEERGRGVREWWASLTPEERSERGRRNASARKKKIEEVSTDVDL